MYDEDCVRDANNWRKAVPTGGNMVDITYLWCYHVTITAFVRKVAEWGGKWEVLTKKRRQHLLRDVSKVMHLREEWGADGIPPSKAAVTTT